MSDPDSEFVLRQLPRTLKLRSNTCGQVLDGAFHFLRYGAIGLEVIFSFQIASDGTLTQS